MTHQTPPLLSLHDISRVFQVRRGLLATVQGEVRAVDNISLAVYPGETLGLVGESGCGKSTLGRIIVRLLQPSEGSMLFQGHVIAGPPLAPCMGATEAHPDAAHSPDRAGEAAFLATLPGRLQMVFQDPFSSLNPRLPIGVSVAEPLRARGIPAAERKASTADMLALVGLDAEHARRFPHEFSGGQRQRIAIARALITHPDLVVCDEAVSALDASVRAQVLNLLDDLRARFGLTYIFVSHDLEVVGHMSDRVAVMYLGQIVELATRDTLFTAPAHPYTTALLGAAPVRDPAQRGRRILLPGELPSPLNPPSGCPFHPRCVQAMPVCRVTVPSPTLLDPDHQVRCHLYAPCTTTDIPPLNQDGQPAPLPCSAS